MGAVTFHNVTMAGRRTAAEAFAVCRNEALYEHGHGGYSGTIAEKSGFVEFALPLGWTPDRLFRTLLDAMDWLEGDDQTADVPDDVAELSSIVGHDELERMARTYDDKWGPAVCVRTETAYHFGGWAND